MENNCSYPAHLSELGEHDDNGGVVLPQHPPEVLHRLVQRALGGDVRVPIPEQSTHSIIGSIFVVLWIRNYFFRIRNLTFLTIFQTS